MDRVLDDASPRRPALGSVAALEDSRRAAERRVRIVASEFLRARPVIVLPFLLFAVATFAWFGVERRQLAGLSCLGTIAIAFFFLERARAARQLVDGRALERSLFATLAALGLACTFTGGLASPVLPMLFAPLGVGFAAFGASPFSRRLLAYLGAFVALFLVAPLEQFMVPDVPRRWVLAAAVLDASLLLRVGVASLTAAHARAGEALLLAGDEVARAAESRTRDLEELGSRVAHELKNPLAAIRALVDVMRETRDDRFDRRLEVTRGEVARLQEIIDGYGAMTRPSTALERTPARVGELLAGLVAILEARAERASVSLRGVPSEGVTFHLDERRFREAVVNLVLNALDATPAGGTVTLSHTVDAGGTLSVVVEDTGCGMDEATLAKVGTPFFSRRTGGTGLGVAMARRVAEQHGGGLEFASRVGQGTTATLRIPRNGA